MPIRLYKRITNMTVAVATMFLCKIAVGQTTEYKVTDYDENEGLHSRTVHCLLQDSRGFMWIGTANGLNQFDGYTFKTFLKDIKNPNSPCGNNVSQLAEDKDHKIWIGFVKGGISCYDPVSGMFRNYSLHPKNGPLQTDIRVSMLFIDSKNELWAGIVGKGLVNLNKTTGEYRAFDIIPANDTLYPPQTRLRYNNVYDAIEDGESGLWLATHDGLYHFNKKTGAMVPIREKAISLRHFRTDLFGSLRQKGNMIWLGSWGGGLVSFNTRFKTWQHFFSNPKQKDQSTTNIISGFEPKDKNTWWVSTRDRGLGTFDERTGRFVFLGDIPAHDPAFSNRLCYGLLKDRNGNIWLSHEGGLMKIEARQKKFRFTPVPVSHSDNYEFYEVSKILEDSAFVFTGTTMADGLHVFNKKKGGTKTFSFDVLKGEEKFLFVNDIVKDRKGNIWIITRDFLYRFNEQKPGLEKQPPPPIYTPDKPSSFFYRAIADTLGNLWIATLRNGVFRYNVATKSYRHFAPGIGPNSIPANCVYSITADDSWKIWIGGIHGCLCYYDTASQKFVDIMPSLRQDTNWDASTVYSLCVAGNQGFWVGTDAGLYKIKIDHGTAKLEQAYTAHDGLKADDVTIVSEDQNNRVWCVTEAGLSRIDAKTAVITTYSVPDSIATGYGNRLTTQGNKMIFTGWRGYFTFDPDDLQDKQNLAPLVITSFMVNGSERHYQTELKERGKLFLKPEENLFSFDFAAIDFNNAAKEQYAYRLVGFDKSWTYSGGRHYAQYTNIPSGDYVFEVKATTVANDWGSPRIAIPVYIGKPFYKTAWFIVTSILFVSLLLYAVYYLRLKKRNEILLLTSKAQLLEKEKAQVMYESLKQQLNPHFLFNSLTSLNSLIMVDPLQARQFLEQMSRIYRYILKNRNSELVTLQDEIRFAQTYISLQKTRFENGLSVHFYVDEQYNLCKIVPVTLQNLIENAIKHNIIDDESPLVINITAADGTLTVENNLQLKNFVETSNKQGLSSMRSLYLYLAKKPVVVETNKNSFIVKIPLL